MSGVLVFEGDGAPAIAVVLSGGGHKPAGDAKPPAPLLSAARHCRWPYLDTRPRPPDASIRWALIQRLSAHRSEAIIAPISSGRGSSKSRPGDLLSLRITGFY